MENPRLVSASLQKIKSIKNPIKHFYYFYFIKSETSDSFINHFDGHFAYLKTLDFYFKYIQASVSGRNEEVAPFVSYTVSLVSKDLFCLINPFLTKK